MERTSRLAACAAAACVTGAMLIGCSPAVSPSGGLTPQRAAGPHGAHSGFDAQSKQSFTHYYMIELGTLGGSASVANSINDRGWVSGISRVRGNAAVHAVLWVEGQKVNLGTLGGPNSGVGWPVKNDRGEIVGISDLAQTDPLAENFCGFGSPNLCAGFRWANNVMTALPTLGGNNSFAAAANDAGQIVGFAENGVHDSSCGAPQVLDYDAAIWKSNGRPRTLPPVSGDTVSQAVAINHAGAAVGASGPCGPPNNLGYGTAHAVLWRQSGKPVDLGNLGGTTGNYATAINDRGDVAGQSVLSGNTTYHAFLWHYGDMSDLGTLPGDVLSEALGLNNEEQAVGYSCDASGDCRGFVWQNGAMNDLNLLVPHSHLYVIYAGDINDHGWIAGQAVNVKTGKASAILLIPANGNGATRAAPAGTVVLPKNVRRQLRQRHGFRFFIE